MEQAFQDLRVAVRTLFRQPGFALLAVLTLGLGIGANTAFFGLVRAVMLRPLPFHEHHRLVRVYQVPRGGGSRISLRPQTFGLLAGAALVAALLPALRAMRSDPAVVLRSE